MANTDTHYYMSYSYMYKLNQVQSTCRWWTQVEHKQSWI